MKERTKLLIILACFVIGVPLAYVGVNKVGRNLLFFVSAAMLGTGTGAIAYQATSNRGYRWKDSSSFLVKK